MCDFRVILVQCLLPCSTSENQLSSLQHVRATPEMYQWYIVQAIGLESAKEGGDGVAASVRITRQGISSLAAIGALCLHPDPAARPSFEVLAAELGAIAHHAGIAMSVA